MREEAGGKRDSRQGVGVGVGGGETERMNRDPKGERF